MTTTKTDLQDLLRSVGKARAGLHPQLDADFVRRVVEIEHHAGEDDQAALSEIRAALDDLVRSLPEDENDA